MEPRYNEDLGTMKITLLYQVPHYITVKKQRNVNSWDQQNYLVIRGFCYIRPLYNEVPLYIFRVQSLYVDVIVGGNVMIIQCALHNSTGCIMQDASVITMATVVNTVEPCYKEV